jgi:Flp pilus assembly pilin Flp
MSSGQSALEWALMAAIFVAALLGAQRFVKATLMGRWRAVADGFGFGRQYEPGDTIIVQSTGS